MRGIAFLFHKQYLIFDQHFLATKAVMGVNKIMLSV